MTSITTLQGTDGITTANAMTKINTNFANLNSDKIETSYLDTDTTLAANSDTKVPTQKAVKAYVDAGGNVNASTTNKGIVEEATDAEVIAKTATGGTGARLFVNPASLSQVVKFGGTGADGALAITSGTTTLDCGSAAVFVKNYTSISITGTAKLAFSNPHANGTTIILKSQGAVIVTSSTVPAIDVSGFGSAGGTGGSGSGTGSGGGGAGGASIITDGNVGVAGDGTATGVGIAGTAALGTMKNTGGAGGKPSSAPAGGISALTAIGFSSTHIGMTKWLPLIPGSGGGEGGASSGSGADGGRGGGALLIECAGAYNCTSTLSAAGVVGGTGDSSVGGGGGGGGGMIVILYSSLTANSGTYTVSGGGAGPASGGKAGGAGGIGFSYIGVNTEIS